MKTALLVFGLLLSSVAYAQPTHRQLKQLNARIETMQNVLQQEREQREKWQSALKAVELETASIQLKQQQTRTALTAQRQALAALKASIAANQLRLRTQQQQLAQQILTTYRFIRQPAIKFVLNQDNVAKLKRMITYYRYISRDSMSLITQLRQTLSTLRDSEQLAEETLQTLNTLKQQQLNTARALVAAKRQREQLIAKINQTIHSKKQKLSSLISNKHALERTLRRLDEQARAAMSKDMAFAARKGKLIWPTQGKILSQFGTQIAKSELRWGGDLIQAPDGQPVVAVAPGRVVYANWLSGYGLLIIINHGQGFMTLYGRNHMLYRKVGDPVQAGELIATVGKSGGYEKPGLYFAIRRFAKPLDPTTWCSRKTTRRHS